MANNPYTVPSADFVTTTLSGALAAAGTTATIGTGLNLPATDGVLLLDYDSTTAVGSDNGPETVSYATYTTGTGALTGLDRGLAGTTDVAHASGAKVAQGPSTLYFGAGEIAGTRLADDSVTYAKIKADAWTSYTPTGSFSGGQTFTIGNGVLSGKYVKIGRTVLFEIWHIPGSSTAYNNGTGMRFTLPVTAAAIGGTTAYTPIGEAFIQDTGTGTFSGAFFQDQTTTGIVVVYNAAGTYLTQNTVAYNVPMTFAATDQIHIVGQYESAA